MEKIKWIFYAVLLSFLWDCCVIFLHPFLNFFICVLILAVLANLLIYNVFVVKYKTAYALICIPAAYFVLMPCFGAWELMFQWGTEYGFGSILVFYYSMFTSICLFVLVMLVRALITKINEKGRL